MSTDAINLIGGGAAQCAGSDDRCRHDDVSQRERARRYPISRWYLRPAAGRLAAALAPTRVRPVHLTLAGLLAASAAAAVLIFRPEAMPLAAVLVLLYWFFDRCDGLLARRQQTASARGAWLDANVDEAVDVGLHVAVAAVAVAQVAAAWPWSLLIALLVGKYLLMYGLWAEEGAGVRGQRQKPPHCVRGIAVRGQGDMPDSAGRDSLLRRIYHFPGNADVRVHLLVLALATGWLTAELAFVAVYYNIRWLLRYLLVVRRLGGVQ